MKIVYIVEMLRYGDRESHSYIDGVYSDRKIAEYNARLHRIYRAGKYDAEIYQMVVDGINTRRDLVCNIYENEADEYYLEDCIKSREDWLKYRELKFSNIKEKK